MMTSIQKKKQGFTLLELLISMAIFSIIIVVVSGIFGNAIHSYRYAYSTQQVLESAQFAMNHIAKTLRTSTIQSHSSSSVTVYDYSQAKCVNYSITGSAIEERFASPTGDPFNDPCDGASFGAVKNLASGDVSGSFHIDQSVEGYVGKASMVFIVHSHNAQINLQTSVSLRDYEVSGLL